MSVIVSLCFLFYLALVRGSCCSYQLSAQEAFENAEVVFLALVTDGQGTATLTLSVSEVFKGTSSQVEMLEAGLVHAKLNCPDLPVQKRAHGVFFGTIGQHMRATMAVNLQSCDPNQVYTACELNSFRSGDFDTSSACDSSGGSGGGTSGSGGDIPTTTPDGECDCSAGAPHQYTSGPFSCRVCTCNAYTISGKPICSASCRMSASCILAPSMIGSSVLVLIFICFMIVWRRRLRAAAASNEVELSDITPTTTNNYAYQPVMTSPVPAQPQVMMTNQGPVVLNTQPMYMMTQTGEPVVVQVAYI